MQEIPQVVDSFPQSAEVVAHGTKSFMNKLVRQYNHMFVFKSSEVQVCGEDTRTNC